MSKQSVEELLHSSEVMYDMPTVDRIRVILYRGSKVYDSFSVKTQPKSKIVKIFVALVGKLIKKVRARRAQDC